MRHLLKLSLLSLLSNFGFRLSLASQDCAKAPGTRECLNEVSPVTSIILQGSEQPSSNLTPTTAPTSSEAGVSSFPRQDSSLPPHPRDSIASPDNDSSSGNYGYRAAAYYVNWVPKNTTITSTLLTTPRPHTVETTSHMISLSKSSLTSSTHLRTSAQRMVRFLSLIRKPTQTSILRLTHGPSLLQI
jgi:hypothetical protein